MTQLTDNVWAYPIPDEAIEVSVYQFKHIGRSIPYWHINWNYPKDHQYTSSGACFFYKMLGGKKKYPTNLQFLFTTKTATEEDAMKVVKCVDSEGRGLIYMNYENGMYVFSKSTSSLRSLLYSKNLDPNKNYALIEKQSSNGTE